MAKGSPTITIRLSPSLLARLKACCKDISAPTSEVVREALETYLEFMGYF